MQHPTFRPQEGDWDRFYWHICVKTGVDLGQYVQDQIRRKILLMADLRAADTLEEFWRRIADSPKELQWFIDGLGTNLSELYRDPQKWEQLKDRILPELLSRNPDLRCWSAGCSFGAEALTLALVLDVHFRGKHSIHGTDIDTGALEEAKQCAFHASDMEGMAPEIHRSYFDYDPSTKRWLAKPEISRYLTFERHNLLSDSYGDDFDLIICRNVLIYFTDAARERILGNFFKALRPGGVLFLGSTESIANPATFGFTSALPLFYRKPLGASVAAV